MCMEQITLIFTLLLPLIEPVTIKQLQIISQALLCVSGRVTMLEISRWAEKGGSYRTLQRFFNKIIPWHVINWAIVKTQASRNSVVLIAGDATTVTKSGSKTFGLGRFFSSIYARAIPGISFQVLSLIDVSKKTSWPILIEQILPRVKTDHLEPTTNNQKSSRGRGRPKGSKNKNKSEVVLNAEITQVRSMLTKLLATIGKTLQPIYFVYDGAFGNNAAAQMSLQLGLHLISKLRCDSKLYLPWEGNYSGKGRPKQYGKRIDCHNIPAKYRKSTEKEGNVVTTIYQMQALHKKFSSPLNVVIICKQNTLTNKQSHVILFSTELNLGSTEMYDYYGMRFQIEFNFRDAKQFWGLEDFMVIQQQTVCNAANIAFWMVNFTQALLPASNAGSMLDLKTHYRGMKYANTVLKLLPQNTQSINKYEIMDKISRIGRIHGYKIAA